MPCNHPRKAANQPWTIITPEGPISGLSEGRAWRTFLHSTAGMVLMHGDVAVAERKIIKVDDIVKC